MGECEGINQPEPSTDPSTFIVVGFGTGGGTVRHLRVPTGSGLHFDCQIVGTQTSGQCFQMAALADGDSIVLEVTPANSHVTSLRGACLESSGTRCTILHPQSGVYDATFRLDVLGSPRSVVYSDDFSTSKTWSTTLLSGSGGSSHSAELSVPGGGLDSYRRMDHTLPPNSSIVVFHRFDDASYDPATLGAISAIDYQERRIVINPPFPGAAVGSAFAIEQNGAIYLATGPTFSNTSWEAWTVTGLTAADFSPAPGPDFSASAPPLFFGYTRSNTNSGSNPGGRVHGIDDWRVKVHH